MRGTRFMRWHLQPRPINPRSTSTRQHTPLISPTRPPEKFRRGVKATRPVSAVPKARRVLGLVIKRGIYSLALVNSQVDHPAPSPSPPALACWIVLAARSQNSSTAKASERAYQRLHRMMNVTNVRPERHWPMGPLADASGPLRPRDVKACESNGGAGQWRDQAIEIPTSICE